MAGERGLYAHAHGFLITRFAHHDDVWVSPQESAHDERKINARFFVDLHLAQALLRDLDRILGRPDLGIDFVEKFQHRVQGGGFAGAGGAAHIEQTVRFGNRFF